MVIRFVQSWRADAHGRLLIWAALYFLLLVVVNVVVNFGTNFTVLRLAYYWLLSPQTVEQSADSWRVMLAALRWLQSGAEDGTLYQEIFFERRMKFQYPPTSLLPLSALEALGAAPTPPLLNAIGRIVIGMTVCAMGALAWILAGRAGWALERRIGAAVLAGGSIFFLFPVMYPY